MYNSLRPHGLQHTRPPAPSPTPRACSNSCLSRTVGHATQPSHPLSSPSLLAFNLSQHQDLFQSVSSSHQGQLFASGAKVVELQLRHQSFSEYSGLISFRIDGFDLLALQGSQESSPISQFRSINSSVLSLLYGPTLISIHDFWKNHSFD